MEMGTFIEDGTWNENEVNMEIKCQYNLGVKAIFAHKTS